MTIMKSISSMGNVASTSAMSKSSIATSGAINVGQSGNNNAGLTQLVGGTVLVVEGVVNGVLFSVLGLVDGLLGTIHL
ncbi:hypothetical protein SAMD00019534_004310 [Acytostelium subglobosum LB1]|uniref:hypothetical protein n=1 Tax=Acytostelium subglobosum LB1 TaxID=1410327 RepID=UPI000644D8DC|nr:hypothetical protein SAMD00019534_004290 [Acytostelium subglobosum LB1]XP_012759318.1 hypothetical protein SAMD00019534_004310 [Acytostelium subglobosum LB1]GAM17254.1 hypothetical protein SAMD00019534_004290 [Acytostelium subglobosum LB1]GAM17256.1 hypothetical protein SAMD00019534_004310 [Acytostelium subglobosum LB1]|eukprot:XP_012759316.1 hypothetical protein SAMD00019534_004290 [Acytostelium subglobosum LB1]